MRDCVWSPFWAKQGLSSPSNNFVRPRTTIATIASTRPSAQLSGCYRSSAIAVTLYVLESTSGSSLLTCGPGSSDCNAMAAISSYYYFFGPLNKSRIGCDKR